mmetsp:Transcript_77131/g.186591  ORF Transcript_77131/g.186591 Transcript_77131/m.186591 type:complete len:558 (+) Transcript_77131:165-1838(+)
MAEFGGRRGGASAREAASDFGAALGAALGMDEERGGGRGGGSFPPVGGRGASSGAAAGPAAMGGAGGQDESKGPEGNDVMFDSSKRETHHPGSGFKKLYRRLRGHHKVTVNKEELSADVLREAKVMVLGGPRDKFSASEFDALKGYVAGGGSLLIALGEGGETRFETNVNFLLEEYGISINADSVVRTVYYKYLHPKEVFVSSGVLNREVAEAAAKLPSARSKDARSSGPKPILSSEASKAHSGLDFVYARGATLNVQKPAVPILSSGFLSYPLNRPVAACYSNKNGGRVAVLGSAEVFGDEYLAKEENAKLMEVLFSWLTHSTGEAGTSGIKVDLDPVDAEEPDVSDYVYLPDTAALSERLRSCLQESEDLPKDFTELFDDTLFRFDTNLIPEAVKLYEALNVKHEPLSLIPPQFETPLPPLQPAVFPPTLRELPPPALDQFDLDEHFASERLRLAQLTNKCTDDDLDYFVREAGDILGVQMEMEGDDHSPKAVLEYIFKKIVGFKKLNQESTDAGGDAGAAGAAGGAAAPSFGSPTGAHGLGPGIAAGFHSDSKT